MDFRPHHFDHRRLLAPKKLRGHRIHRDQKVDLAPPQRAWFCRPRRAVEKAAEVPAVSTSVGARGLTFADGEGCFRRDDSAQFAEAVIVLLRDEQCWGSTWTADATTSRRITRPSCRVSASGRASMTYASAVPRAPSVDDQPSRDRDRHRRRPRHHP